MLLLVVLAKEGVHNVAVDEGAAGAVVGGLVINDVLSAKELHNGTCGDKGWAWNLFPSPLSAENGFNQRGVVHIEDVWSDAYNWPVLLMKTDQDVVEAALGDVVRSPQIGKF